MNAYAFGRRATVRDYVDLHFVLVSGTVTLEGIIIKTVLSRGSWEQIMHLFRWYGRERVAEVFLADYHGLRTLPEPTRRLWELLFLDEAHREDSGGSSEWRCRRFSV